MTILWRPVPATSNVEGRVHQVAGKIRAVSVSVLAYNPTVTHGTRAAFRPRMHARVPSITNDERAKIAKSGSVPTLLPNTLLK